MRGVRSKISSVVSVKAGAHRLFQSRLFIVEERLSLSSLFVVGEGKGEVENAALKPNFCTPPLALRK